MISACLDRLSENVRVQALVIPKLKLVHIQMQILLAHLLERADDPAFHDGSKAFDGGGKSWRLCNLELSQLCLCSFLVLCTNARSIQHSYRQRMRTAPQ